MMVPALTECSDCRTLPPLQGQHVSPGLDRLLTGTKAMPNQTLTTSESYSATCSNDFLRAKIERRKLSMVTCYDYTFARLLSKTAIDGILVGDSAAMVIHGHPSTLSATVDLMKMHVEAVARGAGEKFIVADMPFLSFRKGVAEALEVAQILLSAGAQAVKPEGVEGHEDVIQRMAQSGIPVMGHLGLQ